MIPRDLDVLTSNVSMLKALGLFAQDVIGASTAISGLSCSPSTPAALSVQIGLGRIYSPQVVDAGAYGSLPADATSIIKQGMLSAPVTLNTPAPIVAGQSIAYLIEVQYQDIDSNSTLLGYFNALNPTSPLSGAGGLGVPQATQRLGLAAVQVKAGISAVTGTQVTPTVDAGWTGAWVVTVAFGAASVVAGNIAQFPGAPFLTFSALTALTQANADLRYLQQYFRTPAEITAGVTPVNLVYAPYNVLRYGADPTGVAISTTAFTNALAVAVTGGSGVIYAPFGTYLIGALSATMPGSGGDPRVGPGLRIYGDGVNATILKQSGSPAGQLLNIQSSNPATTLADGHILIENLTLFGVGKTCHGLSLQGIADWQLRNVQIHDFDRGLNLQSTLIGHLEGNWAIFSNNTGIFGGTGGTPSPTNLISFNDGRLLANSTWGADFGNGSSIRFNGTDIENNGTTGNTSTGAIVLRSTLSSGFSFSQVSFDDTWFEANQGQCFKTEVVTGLTLSFKDCLMLGNDAGRDLLIAGATSVSIDSCSMATATGAVSSITCNLLHIKNSAFTTLTDLATVPYYENVTTSAGSQTWGRHTQWVATLVGCTTAPTVTVDAYQQGDEIKMNFFSSLQATSNTTTCSVTGCPVALRPPFTRGDVMCAIDNGLQIPVYSQMSAAGVLTLGVGHAFTASSGKGLDVCQFRYRLGA